MLPPISEQLALSLAVQLIALGAAWMSLKAKADANRKDITLIKEALGLENGHSIDHPAFVRRSEFESHIKQCPYCRATRGDT